MIRCPKKLNFDDRWIALSLVAHLIKSDDRMMGLEIRQFKDSISQSLGIESDELVYFDELMNRDYDPAGLEKIGPASDAVIGKHIVKEVLHLSMADGDYSDDEKQIIVRWAEKNDLDAAFVDQLEDYVRLVAGGADVDSDAMRKAERAAEVLLNG